MTRPDGAVGILAPAGPDRRLLRDLVESGGWVPRFPAEGSDPEGPWRDVDVIVVELAWLDRFSAAIERTKRDAGSEFVPVLLLASRAIAPAALPELCDQVLVYPTTRAAFTARLGALVQARIESRRVYRSIFENTVIGVYRANMDGRLSMANDALARMLGCEDAADLQARDVRIPELRDGAAGAPHALVEELGRTGVARAIPGYWDAGDGRGVHVLHSARIVRGGADDEAGPVVEGTVEDVTDLVESRERSARSERFLQSAIDALSAHVAILDPDGEIVGVNEAWRLFEASTRPPDANDIGVNYLDVCALSRDPIATRVEEGIRGVIGGERRVFQMEYPCHSATQFRWFRVVVTAFPEDPPRRVVVAHENVTELKRAQRRFQLLIEGSSELTLVVGETGLIEYGSPSAAECLGATHAEGRELRAYVHPSDRDVLARLPELEDDEYTMEFRVRRADGAWRDMEWSVTDMRDQPMVHGFVLHGRDVTDRKSMLAELRAREREIREMQKMEAVGRLAGGVAHDFNNLLTTIQGNLQLAQGELGNEDESPGQVRDLAQVDEYLSEISRAAEQGSFLTRRLLVFSSKEPEADPTLEDLNEILDGLGKLLKRLVPETIAVEIDTSAESLPVMIRPGEVEQVVVNLTVNAVDAMREGGSLTIRTGRVEVGAIGSMRRAPAELEAGVYAVLEAIDTGEGIPTALREKIFEPFFTTKPRGEGTGLGLATVYGILTRAGGGITVYSEEGIGTRFTAYLPLATEERAESPVAPSPDGVEAGGGETLLLVEDETSVRTVARRGLERLGYTVLEAEHGAAALEILASPEGGKVALVVSDFVMPVMSGLELSRALHVRYPGIPVLITSGYPDSDLDLPAELMWETLSKPYDFRVLARVVRRLIEAAGTSG